ncbi:MAG: hypothetical protein LBS84_05755 [Clostridiales bacterium]|jgi:hypothetical protein|nr:hypothetical protein [Clostridiales bacterium]
MNVTDVIQVVLTVIGAWSVIVFLLYFLLIKMVGYKNAGFLARALYSIYLVLMLLYSLFLSPYTRYVRFLSTGFYIALVIFVILLLFVILTGMTGGRAGKGGGSDA